MQDHSNVTLLLAVWAGLASFVSPCVLPLIPSYLTFITGLSLEDLSHDGAVDRAKRLRVMAHALTHTAFFVLGFSLVFIGLGATATTLGRALQANQALLSSIGGIFVFFFGLFITEWLNEKAVKRLAVLTGVSAALAGLFYGLMALPDEARRAVQDGLSAIWLDFLLDFRAYGFFFAGLAILFSIVLVMEYYDIFRISTLLRDVRFNLANKPSGFVGTSVVGITFALGWTPCVGPILGSILVIANSEQNVSRGIVLLCAYSLGLAIPFFISAAAFSWFMKFFKTLRRHLHTVTVVSGLLLMSLGVLLGTGSFVWLVGKLTQWLPFLQPRI